MKKIITTLALMLTLGTGFSFAGEIVNQQTLDAFKSEFAGATDVTWTIGKSYYKVAFTINDKRLFGYYDNEGELIAVTRFVSPLQLPHKLQNGLKKSYKDFWISDLFEVRNSDEHSYYVTLENADAKIVLRSVDKTNWRLFEKIEK